MTALSPLALAIAIVGMLPGASGEVSGSGGVIETLYGHIDIKHLGKLKAVTKFEFKVCNDEGQAPDYWTCEARDFAAKVEEELKRPPSP